MKSENYLIFSQKSVTKECQNRQHHFACQNITSKKGKKQKGVWLFSEHNGLDQPASWSGGNAFVSGAGDGGSNLGPCISETVLLTARHRCGISSGELLLPGGNDAEMGLAHL